MKAASQGCGKPPKQWWAERRCCKCSCPGSLCSHSCRAHGVCTYSLTHPQPLTSLFRAHPFLPSRTGTNLQQESGESEEGMVSRSQRVFARQDGISVCHLELGARLCRMRQPQESQSPFAKDRAAAGWQAGVQGSLGVVWAGSRPQGVLRAWRVSGAAWARPEGHGCSWPGSCPSCGLCGSSPGRPTPLCLSVTSQVHLEQHCLQRFSLVPGSRRRPGDPASSQTWLQMEQPQTKGVESYGQKALCTCFPCACGPGACTRGLGLPKPQLVSLAAWRDAGIWYLEVCRVQAWGAG